MKKRLGIYIIMLLACYACNKTNSQKDITDNKITNRSIKKFDIQKFNALGNDKTFMSGDSVVSFVEFYDFFMEKRSKINSNIEHRSHYSKKNMQLTLEGDWLFEIPIGTYRTYDASGVPVEEINSDKDYPFTVEQLISKVKEQFNINLLTSKLNIDATRFPGDHSTNNLPIYRVKIRNEVGSEEREIKIDGINGNILKDHVYYVRDCDNS